MACKPISQERYIAKAIEVHGNKFDYSRVVYQHSNIKIEVGCKECGTYFFVRPAGHLQGYGCRKCAMTKLCAPKPKEVMLQRYLEKAHNKFKDRFVYKVETFTHPDEKMTIICQVHGEFRQSLSSHIFLKHGCPACGDDVTRQRSSYTQDTFLQKAVKKHGDKYDYSDVIYVNSTDPVLIRCKKHNTVFSQAPASHLAGKGCSLCGFDRVAELKTVSQEEFLRKVRHYNGDKYDLSQVVYKGYKFNVKLICPTHGAFFKDPRTIATQVSGCPRCRESVGEQVIASVLDRLGLRYIREAMIPGNLFRYDFYLPDHYTYIEFHGIQHFEYTERFHRKFQGYLKYRFRDEVKEKLVRSIDEELIVLTYRDLENNTLEQKLISMLERFNVL